MTGREKKFTFMGLGLGLALAAVLYLATGSARHAAPPPAPVAAVPAGEGHDHSAPAAAAGEELGAVELSAEEQAAAGVRTAEVRPQTLLRGFTAVGRVEEAETQLATVSARVGGRIDKLYVSYTGQSVGRGQPIALIYSPDLLATAEEYKLALENRERLGASSPAAREQAEELVTAARRRLELWDIGPKQIAEIEHSAQPKVQVTVHSPASGIVTERRVTEGQYVQQGEALYTLTDLSTVWVKADVYQSDLPQVRVGQAVEIASDALPGKTLRGQVGFIEPAATAETRTIPVRIQVANPGLRLRPGMYANVNFRVAGKQQALAVPRSAVIDTGKRQLVYVARGDGVFEGREVQLGPASDGMYPVVAGLKTGERVVTEGNFLIDSQTRLTGGMSGLYGGSKEFATEEAKGTNGSAEPPKKKDEATLKFTLRTSPDPPKGAADNKFRVTITGADGKAVSDAKVKVRLVMPAMPGMGEMRSSADLEWNGSEYAGEGSVPMSGSWYVTVEATRNGQPLGTHKARLNAQ